MFDCVGVTANGFHVHTQMAALCPKRCHLKLTSV
jgi:hypothetical protein